MRAKIFVAFVTAIISGSVSGIGAYLSQGKKYGSIIERLSKESQYRKNKLDQLSNKVTTLNSEINKSELEFNSLTESHKQLSRDYQILTKDYEKCISSNGSITVVNPLDIKSHSHTFKTGDYLEFELTSRSFFISILRVSKDGPVISLSGCQNYITDNEIKIGNKTSNRFIVRINRPLKIRFTIQSCEDDENIDPSIVEEITLSVNNYNVKKQHVNLFYVRKPL